jgi:hypothetical protein
MADEATFTVGPPQPVVDSRKLPAVTAADEAGFVHGVDLGKDHPDNVLVDGDLPSEDQLDALVADVDTAAADGVGFDDADLAEP